MANDVAPPTDLKILKQPVHIISSLIAISKLSRRLMTIKLSDIGLFAGQDELLLALTPEAPLTVSSLAQALNVQPSTVSKMVDRLTSRRFIERGPGLDNRSTMISLTPKGLAMRETVIVLHEKLEGDLQKRLAVESSSALISTELVLRHMVSRLR